MKNKKDRKNGSGQLRCTAELAVGEKKDIFISEPTCQACSRTIPGNSDRSFTCGQRLHDLQYASLNTARDTGRRCQLPVRYQSKRLQCRPYQGWHVRLCAEEAYNSGSDYCRNTPLPGI